MDSDLAYKEWIETVKDTDLKRELYDMDERQKYDAFYRDLEFGTGGLRGILGAGSNRMNYYTVSKATQGLTDYLKSIVQDRVPSVAIAYDSRIHSEDFAKAAAAVLAANGCCVYLFSELAPTPVLSYAVRTLHCDAGIVITASHNPAKYNGYKVYKNDGCQITLEAANRILSCIEKVHIFTDTKTTDFEKAVNAGQIQWIKNDLMQSFIEKTKACAIHPELLKQSDLKVIYTPLNGTGNKPVRQALTACGLKNICVVPTQENPDGNFSTCPKPNPEERAAFHEALGLATQNPADILLATDPDCDRVGIAVRDNKGDYVLLTGNETGCLLLEYIFSQKQANHTMPKKPVAIKTIVTTAMAYTIASEYNVQIIDTLTGFKFIGEQIGCLEQKGEENRYVFGFEESYGYLLGTYVRDKDAVSASVLICEMAAYYKKQGISLLDALSCLYQKYGCWKHKLLTFSFEGEEGQIVMRKIEEAFRNDQYNSFAGLAVHTKDDYLYSVSYNRQTGKSKTISLPKSNVLVFGLEQGGEVVLRPSGTEPKFKCYLTAKGKDIKSATACLNALEEDMRHIIGSFSK